MESPHVESNSNSPFLLWRLFLRVVAKALIASPDIVAADTAAVKLAEQFTKIKVEDVVQIRLAEELKLGTSNLESLNVRRVRV